MPGNEVELPELFAPELDEREDDVRAGQAILDELVPTLAALPPSPFPAGVPLGRAALAALRRVEQVDAPGLRAPADDADTTLRADLALLPARLWRADCVEDTRRYALALLAARRQAATARAGQSAAALPVAPLAAATEVRGRMMALLSYHLGRRGRRLHPALHRGGRRAPGSGRRSGAPGGPARRPRRRPAR
ncbi:MAG: hypothetical protein R3F43_32360 [bacterium]